METIGQRIKAARERANMTQSQLADKVNITSQLLYKYEHDFITNIPSDKIEEIARALRISPAFLMGWVIPKKINKECYIKISFDDFGECRPETIDPPQIDSEEKQIINAYRASDDATKLVIKRVLAPFLSDDPELTNLKLLSDDEYEVIDQYDASDFDEIITDADFSDLDD